LKVLVLGGDGYLGWPTAMNLTRHGHEVAVVDNYLRRNLMKTEKVEPLFPVPELTERAALWEKASGERIQVHIGDLAQWDFIAQVFESFNPEAVVHFAEQPSAPYSMIGRKPAILTLQNNLNVTMNVIFAVREFTPNAHIIKLGTMGEYGTPNIDIEEGWLDVKHNDRAHTFLYPRQAGSLYHTTKIMDTDLLWFYIRTWGLRVTDLMQGPVYGIHTEESGEDERLTTFLSYDEIFGTVINRFIVQAVADIPLTVYGKGGQTRGYLNIIDTLNCIRLAVENSADKGELRIFNQFTETFTVNELAEKVVSVGAKLGLNVTVNHIDNPRKELEEHYYNPKNTGLIELGLKPHFLTEDVLIAMMEKVKVYKDNIDENKIFPKTKWV
jgi:UDP-sulfoquinovose synthase